jgi:hypothetical protein
MTQGADGAEAPIHILDLAAACVRFVERAIGLPLDFTPDTLPVLDHYLRTAKNSSTDEIMNLVVPAAGAYFGEVVRRELGPARWHWDEDASQVRLEFERCFLSFNPMGSAIEAVHSAAGSGFGAHFTLLREEEAAVEASLSRMGDIREEDFYRLAVRFETLEQIVGLLVDHNAATSQPYRVFGADVYAALREGKGSGVLH